MNDFPCKCGHPFDEHKDWEHFSLQRCQICISPVLDKIRVEDNDITIILASWHNYTPDNLKYLEQLYESENK